MTLHVVGKISIQDTTCEKCNASIRIWKKSDKIKCKECGSIYILQSSEPGDQHIDYMFEFSGFECVFMAITSDCNNLCPAPGIFCKDHTSDDSFKAAQNSIFYTKERLRAAEAILEQMEESKKIYLVEQLANI